MKHNSALLVEFRNRELQYSVLSVAYTPVVEGVIVDIGRIRVSWSFSYDFCLIDP